MKCGEIERETFVASAFTDGELITMFFRLYNELPIELTTRVLQNIVQLSSLRRTLFSNPERQTYLTHIVKGVKAIMEQPDKLRQQVLPRNVVYFNCNCNRLKYIWFYIGIIFYVILVFLSLKNHIPLLMSGLHIGDLNRLHMSS